MNFNYNKKLKVFARKHRNESTRAEIKLWCDLLRNKQMLGFSFLRQRPFGPFIVDFFCKELKLAIETDGYTHHFVDTFKKDIEKTEYLKSHGISLLRFDDDDVMKDIDNVKKEIERWIEVNHPPAPFKGGTANPGGVKFKKLILTFFSLLLLFTSCEEWLDINKDPNNPDEVNEELTLAAGISSLAYVYGGKYQVLGALWSQHWTQSPGASQYTGLDSYDINSSTYDNQYNELYTGALKNFEYIRNLAYQKQNWGYYLIATVMQCYTYQLLVDLYDEIPFSEALKGDEGPTTPHFEKGQDIYDSLINRINFALDQDFELESVDDVGDEDLLFSGDIELWKEFANTLKLKIYLRQVYARPEVAENGIRALFADKDNKFLTEDAAMTQFTNEEGRGNPLYETEILFFGNPNLIMSFTLYDYMTDKFDVDRLDAMFNYPEVGGGHEPLIQGDLNNSDIPAGTNSSSYSKPVFNPYSPVYLMSATEAYFLLAEAIIRFNVDSYSKAMEYYESGLEWSFISLLYNGTNATDVLDLVEEMLESGGSYEFPAEGSPVDEFIKTIAMQKWVSLAGIQSIETFLEQNRTGYPAISDVGADNGDYEPGELTISVSNVTSGKFPRRLIFPESEYSGNPNTPAKKEVYEKVWWDVNGD